MQASFKGRPRPAKNKPHQGKDPQCGTCHKDLTGIGTWACYEGVKDPATGDQVRTWTCRPCWLKRNTPDMLVRQRNAKNARLRRAYNERRGGSYTDPNDRRVPR